MSDSGGANLATVGLRIDGDRAVTDLDRFERSADRAGRSGERLEKMARGLRSTLLSMGLALGASLGVGAFFHALVENTKQAQYAFAQLEAGVRSTGGAAGFSATQLDQMAGRLQSLTTFEDEAIEGAQALLLTFTNIRGDVFKDATASVLDLAQRMGGDLNGAAIQVGKALQDPIRGMLALRRSGVSFSQSQQQVIRDLVNTGQVVAAQRLILQELTTEFGGAAAAARNTLGGALTGLKHAFGDLFEVSPSGTSGIVAFIHDLEALLVNLKTNVLPQVGIVFQWLWGVLRSAVDLWRDLPTGVKATIAVFGVLALTIPSLAQLVVFLTGTVLKLAAAFRAVAAAESLAALLSPTGWLMLGLAAVAAAFGYVGYKALQAANDARLAAEEFRQALEKMDEATLRTTSGSLVQQWSMVDKALEEHRETLRALQTLSSAPQSAGMQSPGYQQQAADWLRQRLGIHAGTQQSQVADLIRSETQTVQALEAQQRVLTERGNAAAEEVRRRRELANGLTPPPMVDVSSHPDNTDAVRAREEQNRKMVEAAQDAITLAGMQGQAQERLRIQFEATSKEAEAWADVQTRSVYPATLAAIRAERELKLQALDVATLREQTQAREDSARSHAQAVTLLTAEGAAQTRLRIEYEATNKAIEAQRNFEPDSAALTNELASIATERVQRLAEEQMRIFVAFRSGAREQVRGLFEDIYNNGLGAFKGIFDRAREMFGRLVADLASKRLMSAIGNNVADGLGRLYGGANRLDPGVQQQRAAVALTGSATALSSSAAALTAAAARLGMATAGSPGGTYSAPLDWASDAARAQNYGAAAARQRGATPLPGVVATARPRSEEETAREAATGFAKAFAKYAAPAMAGFFAGMGVGSGTTNRGVGVVGGAVAGAASGFLVAGPLGAAIGGLTGAIGGFIGASKRREEAERVLQEMLGRNADRLRELSENISGLSLFAGKNLDNAQAFAAALAGLNNGLNGFTNVPTSKDFAAALKGAVTADWLKPFEKQFGITIQDIGRMAQQFGIELFDSAGRAVPAALKQLEEALRLATFAATHFTDSMDDLKLRQEAYNKLFDVPDTPINKLNDAYEQLAKGAPDLLKQMGLANLDLSSEAARKVLLSGLQDIFKLIDSGLLTPDLLGAFKDKEGLIQALLGAKAGLDAFKQSLSTVTTDFPQAMRLIEYEQRFGKGVGAGSAGTGTPTSAPPRPPDTSPGGAVTPHRPVSIGTIIVYNNAGDTTRDLAGKLQDAIEYNTRRGGALVGDTVSPGSTA